jgi:hypothetical protein
MRDNGAVFIVAINTFQPIKKQSTPLEWLNPISMHRGGKKLVAAALLLSQSTWCDW